MKSDHRENSFFFSRPITTARAATTTTTDENDDVKQNCSNKIKTFKLIFNKKKKKLGMFENPD